MAVCNFSRTNLFYRIYPALTLLLILYIMYSHIDKYQLKTPVRSSSGLRPPTAKELLPPTVTPKMPELNIYDLGKPPKDNGTRCVWINAKLLEGKKAKICIHNVSMDIYVSGSLGRSGIWEPAIVTLFRDMLKSDLGLGLLDLGANLGLYSLVAATMGRKVLAVEPMEENINNFHRSIHLNSFQDRVILVANAVANKHEKVFFKLHSRNKGGTSMFEGKMVCAQKQCPSATSIYMDDLLPIVKSLGMHSAVMKLDIEGAEHLALAHASGLFSYLRIPFILMEVRVQAAQLKCGNAKPQNEDTRLVKKMFKFLIKEGFTRVFPYTKKGNVTLDPANCKPSWPMNVLWVHNSQRYPLN